MNKKFKFLAIGFLALALVVGMGAGTANAALTLGALAVTSDGVLAVDGAAGSANTLMAATTTGSITLGAGLTTGLLTLGNTSSEESLKIGGVTTGTTLTSFLFAPKASATTSGISYHELMRVASTLGDPLHRTYGLSSEFSRSAVVSASFDGTDTGFVSKIDNSAANTQAYNMQGAYIKAKNTGTVTGIKALDLEVQPGTSTNAYGLTIHGNGTFTDIQLQDTSTIGAGVTSDTSLYSMQFTPKASATTSGISYHELMRVASTFGDPLHRTYGLSSEFTRIATPVVSASFDGTDTGLVSKVTNTATQTQAYNMQGAYIKAKNTGTVTGIKALDLEVQPGTSTNAYGLTIHGNGTFTDIQLQDGSTIATGGTSGTHQYSMLITPKVLTATTSTVNEVVKIDGTGGFADVGANTYGIQASFDRAVATTSDIGGFDTGFDLRVTNDTDVSNNAAYDMQGMYIKIRNKSGGIVDQMRGIDLEVANDGTTTNAVGINIHGSGTFTDIVLQKGETIDNKTDGVVLITAPAVAVSNAFVIPHGAGLANAACTPSLIGAIYMATTTAENMLADKTYVCNAAGNAWVVQTP